MPDWSDLGDAYLERVYAGVLGKICGVYLGRPVEGWSRERIVATFGEVDRYLHESVGVPLIVADDDIGGTFTFVRALADHGFPEPLLAEQVGRTWLDRLVHGRSVLWWGGRGVSTEHTAYLNLEAGIPAPASGSAARNGTVVAEQIGAQIFIDAWAMVCPGDPAGAAELAEAAARVSHDGEAVAAARLVAAVEALAFDSDDLRGIIEAGLGFVDSGGLVAALVRDLLRWRADTGDWRVARDRLDRDWGYHRYGGGCHVLPNLGVVLLALLWGGGDLTRTLTIAVTCGWDTDCNAGTAGCIVALAAGLDAFDTATDFRGPVGDRLYLSSSDGGRAVTDAVRESRSVQAIARGRRGLAAARPAGAPRYDFALPGSTQGFRCPPEWPGTVEGRSRHDDPDLGGLTVHGDGPVAQVTTAVFVPPDFVPSDTYTLLASPALYPGQLIRARVSAPADTDLQLVLTVYDEHDATRSILGPAVGGAGAAVGGAGSAVALDLVVPDLAGFPVAEVGVRATRPSGAAGFVLHDLGWTGSPRATLSQAAGGTMWRSAWLHGLDHPAPEPFGDSVPEFALTQNRGTGLVSTGCDDWDDVALRAVIRPHSTAEFGLAVAVAGLRRYVALLVRPDGTVRLVRRRHEETELARAVVLVELDRPVELRLESGGGRLRAWVDGMPVADVEAGGPTAGAVALLVTEGTVTVDDVTVAPTAG